MRRTRESINRQSQLSMHVVVVVVVVFLLLKGAPHTKKKEEKRMETFTRTAAHTFGSTAPYSDQFLFRTR